LHKEQKKDEGYEKRWKELVNGESKGSGRQKTDMGREKERLL